MDMTLYPGLAFSPQAELSEGVGAADTILKVSDSSRFPPPPNLATIGTDEEGETILYTAKQRTPSPDAGGAWRVLLRVGRPGSPLAGTSPPRTTRT